MRTRSACSSSTCAEAADDCYRHFFGELMHAVTRGRIPCEMFKRINKEGQSPKQMHQNIPGCAMPQRHRQFTKTWTGKVSHLRCVSRVVWQTDNGAVQCGARRGTKPWQDNGKELMRIQQWDHGLDRIHLQVSQRQHWRTHTDKGNAIFDFGRRPHRCRRTGRGVGF